MAKFEFIGLPKLSFEIFRYKALYIWNCFSTILLSLSDKPYFLEKYNVRNIVITAVIFAGMLVLIGVTCYATLNWN